MINRLKTSENGDIHRGRPTNALLLVLLTIFWMVLSAGILFHSNDSRIETSDNELGSQLTIFFEAQNLVKSRVDLIFDVCMHGCEITIDSRAEDRNMVWIIVGIVP